MKELYANVAFNLPLENLFTYKIPEHLISRASKGKRVIAGFGNKKITGMILGVSENAEVKNIEKIKNILDVLDENVILQDELIELCYWISDYYSAPIGEVIFSAVPGKLNVSSDKYFFLSENYLRELDSSRLKEDIYIRIIEILEKAESATKKQLERKLKFNDLSSALKTLSDGHIIYSENHYSKPVSEKKIKTVRLNFSKADTEKIILKNKIRSEKQIKFIKELNEDTFLNLKEISDKAGISPSSVNTLLKKELIEIKEIREFREPEDIFREDIKTLTLNPDQENILSGISENIDENIFKVFLLFGVTGSGKTEVYINLIKRVLKNNKTAIVLVPEISLTPQLIYRFRNVFGSVIGVIHSKLSDGERKDTFERIVNGSIKIVIGARSAIFAPLKNIGIIVVDEEHDSSYKQENSPRYNGRDCAVYRGKINNAPVILGSATPSIESFYNARSGKYGFFSLPLRATNIKMPEIKIIDLLKKNKESEYDEHGNYNKKSKDFFDTIDKIRIKFLSKELIYEIGERLEKKESVIILQNRRGYHSYLECLSCGEVEMCIRCNIALTYHKSIELLKCHFCGFSKKKNKFCSSCGSDRLIAKGAGTERVEEELEKIFPAAVIKRIDSDSLNSKRQFHRLLKDFYDKKIDILAGTQIISKGLDFPEVTLVGVVNADIGLLNPDFRATEKTFQILTQVSGRSGRSEKKGEVLIQTNHSEFHVFENVKNHDYLNFYEKEIAFRKQLNYPPFSRLVIIESKSEDKNMCESKIKEIYNLITTIDKEKILEVLPPNPPVFSKLKDKYRYHLIIKSVKERDLSGSFLKKILREVKNYTKKNVPKKVMITIDVDAVNLM
ncbi:MAG: primosomal protein N' [Bacteroidetes bacterium]|nr:primosomal protein N' [Bacteroidota bacterium]